MRRVLLLLAFVAPAATAQVPEPPVSPETQVPGHTWAVWAGASGSAMLNPLFVSARLSTGVEYQAAAFSLGYTHAGEFWSSAAVNIVSAAAGFHTGLGPFRVSALVGPSLAWGTAGLSYPRERYVKPGGTVEASILFPLSRTVELGLEGHAHVNAVFTSAGVGPTLRINLVLP